MKHVDQHDLMEPWALRAWHIDYKVFTGLMSQRERLNARKRMLKIRREASLERIVARQQRTIEAQAEQISVLASLVRLKYGNLDQDVNAILESVGHGW